MRVGMEGTGKASPGSRVTAVALSGSPGSSAGSHHFHCTIPTGAIDNAHSGDFVLHFLLQFSYFLPQALPLLLSAPSVFSHCYSCCSSAAHTGGVAHSDLQSSHGREFVIPSNTVSHFPSAFRQGRTLLHPLHFQVVYSWILGFF